MKSKRKKAKKSGKKRKKVKKSEKKRKNILEFRFALFGVGFCAGV
jgi:hypothetical protein